MNQINGRSEACTSTQVFTHCSLKLEVLISVKDRVCGLGEEESYPQDHDVYKRRLDSSGKVINPEGEKHEVGPQQDPELESKHNGTYCGSCYGAGSEGECCNSCEEVRYNSL